MPNHAKYIAPSEKTLKQIAIAFLKVGNRSDYNAKIAYYLFMLAYKR